MNMVEVDVSEYTNTLLEILALSENLAPSQLIGVMLKEYTDTDQLENRVDFATSETRVDRIAALSMRRAAIAAVKGASDD